MTFAYTLSWKTKDGTMSITVSDCASERQARLRCLASARRFGWTKPKWWQWSRRHDTTHRESLGI